MAELNSSSTSTSGTSPESIEQAKVSMAEIAMLSLSAKQLASQATMEVGGNRYAISLIDVIQVIAEKTGFLADLCLDKLGAGLHVGGAEDWMLPPSYHEAKSKD